MSLNTPNAWQYAKDWKYCALCKMLRLDEQLVEMMNVGNHEVKLAGVFACKDRAECDSFRTTGHGLKQWPVSKTSGERHAEMPEPPVDQVKDQRAEEEFWGDNI